MKFSELRINAGLTQKQIEDYLNLKSSTVSKWEKGKVKPKLEYLEKISKLLNCELQVIIDCFVDNDIKEIEI